MRLDDDLKMVFRFIDKGDNDKLVEYLKDNGKSDEYIEYFLSFLDCKTIDCLKEHLLCPCIVCGGNVDKLYCNQKQSICEECFETCVVASD